jgi:aryl-alcohol dehydrogenase-like predicted oxidoreductase
MTSPASIKYALDNSLQRLQTDYLDLSITGQSEKPFFLDKEVLKSKRTDGKIISMLFWTL